MNCLEKRIVEDGIVKEGKKITKILTIEASGIGIACIVA